jgi:enoyl-CoA hydratase
MTLHYEKKDKIAWLTIDRPASLNSLDPDTIIALLEAWEDYRDDPDCLCAIVTGVGYKAFCSGMDLDAVIPIMTGSRSPSNEAEQKLAERPEIIDQATLRNFELYKPVIAAVNGFAIAAGMEIVQATDIRIASGNAKFGLQEAKWGLFPLGGSTVRLPRQIPYSMAMELMLTGELIDSREAERIGFINRVVRQENLLDEAERIARSIVRNGPLAVRRIKESVLRCSGLSIEAGLAQEQILGREVFNSKDAKEGPRAFLEKREPRFTGE